MFTTHRMYWNTIDEHMNLSGGLIYICMLSFILESKPYSETSLTGISSYISCSLILKIEKGEGARVGGISDYLHLSSAGQKIDNFR